MITIKLKDTLCAHEPSFFNTKNQNKIKISRNSIDKNDIVIYTNISMLHTHPNAKINIGFVCESYENHCQWYKWIEKNKDKFDIVLTWNKKLLESDPDKFKLQLYGTTWINHSLRKIYKKSKLCSIIASNKKQTTGHKLRHSIIDYLINNNINKVDFFGARFNNLPYMNTKGYTNKHSGQHISNKKIDGLQKYMFSICILPSKIDYEFDEKLIDCFLTGTVPIFWGCPGIHKFFDINGIIIFDTIEECIQILNTLSLEKYKSMLPYIEKNFETAKNYTNFKFNENAILNTII